MGAEEQAFDRAFQRRSNRLTIRPEQADDLRFVHRLAERCSPLAGLLPPQLLEQQAKAQEASHRSEYPGAMRRIVSSNGIPIGRIVVEWQRGGVAHGIDIAVLPEFRSSGAGLHMLRAWLDVSDSTGSQATLYVRADNPVVPLYRRLGFRVSLAESGDRETVFLHMVRPSPNSATAVAREQAEVSSR